MLTAKARADIEATIATVKSPHLRQRLLRRMADTAYAQHAASDEHSFHVRSQQGRDAYVQLSMGSGYRLAREAEAIAARLGLRPPSPTP